MKKWKIPADMKVRTWLLSLALILFLVFSSVPVYAQPPSLPHAFFGNLTVGASPAVSNTTVVAKVAGVEQGRIVTTVTGKYGGRGPLEAKLIVQGSIADGSIISFYVNNILANETYPFKSGETTELNLSATAPTLTPTPTPTPTPTIPTKREGFFGTVKTLSPNSFTLDTKQGVVTFTVNADTEYWDPPKKDANLSDVKVGARIAVLAERTASTLLVKRVLIIPPKPIHEQITGVVTKISGTDITITYDTDKTIIADAPPGIARKIELGDLVTAVIIRTPGTEKVLLKDIESSDKLLDRLEQHAAKKTGKDKDEIERLLERNRQKQQEALQRVLAKVPEAAKQAIQRAIEKTKGKPLEAPGKAPPSKAPATPGKAPERTKGKS